MDFPVAIGGCRAHRDVETKISLLSYALKSPILDFVGYPSGILSILYCDKALSRKGSNIPSMQIILHEFPDEVQLSSNISNCAINFCYFTTMWSQ